MKKLSLVLLLGTFIYMPTLDLPVQADSGPWSVYVNGQMLDMEQTPYVQDGRLMVPARAVAQALGAVVGWSEAHQAISITDSAQTIVLTLGSSQSVITKAGTAPVNVFLDVPPKKVGGRIFLPLRFVAENLQAKVKMEEAARTISITRLEATTENPSRGGMQERPELPSLVAETIVAEKSVAERDILFYYLGEVESANKIAIVGSMHGDEPQGEYIVEQLRFYLHAHPNLLVDRQILLIPCGNPDGLAQNSRTNANGTDLNRNFPTQNWGSGDAIYGSRYYQGISPASEEETRLLIKHITAFNPRVMINIHAPLRLINYDGAGSAPIASFLARFNHYQTTQDIGYPTPGSFGTYFGKERGIPTITLETGGDLPAIAWMENKDGLVEIIAQLPLLLP